MKRIIFPNLDNFGELFLHWDKYDISLAKKKGSKYQDIQIGKSWFTGKVPGLKISFYCSLNNDNYCSLLVKPKPFVVKYIEKDMIHNDDIIYFNIVFRDEGALIIAKHNSIIASRWLAIVKRDTVPVSLQADG